MAKTTGNIRSSKKSSVSLKSIFNDVSALNPERVYSSSIGGYRETQSGRMLADATYIRVANALPKNSLAYSVLTGTKGRYSEKQLWVISYGLQKSKSYTRELNATLNRVRAKKTSKANIQNSKATSQIVLNSIKASGHKLGDYYAWLKGNKKYRHEFFSKQFTSKSGIEFVNANRGNKR